MGFLLPGIKRGGIYCEIIVCKKCVKNRSKITYLERDSPDRTMGESLNLLVGGFYRIVLKHYVIA